jgi:hypothetical protein
MRHGHGADRVKKEWNMQKQETLRLVDMHRQNGRQS